MQWSFNIWIKLNMCCYVLYICCKILIPSCIFGLNWAESINMPKNNQTFVTNARTLINPVSEKNMLDIHQNIISEWGVRIGLFIWRPCFENRHFSRFILTIPARIHYFEANFKDFSWKSSMSLILALGVFGKVEPMLCSANSNFTANFAAIFFRNGQNRLLFPW